MKQLLQNYLNGEMAIHDVPAPRVRPGGLLVATGYSLISAGTERALVELARKGLIEKARSRPDLVRKVLDKARTEGVLAAYQKSIQRLDSLDALGYSSAGVVLEVGDGVDGFTVGTTVACGGIGYASHAETVFVPRNLAARVPETVDLEHAAFTTVGAIALQGVRTAGLQLGETAAVIGLGLVGLITTEILRAAGCRVVGLDLDASRCALATTLGCDRATTLAEELAPLCRALGDGQLADAAIVTAASDSDVLLTTAAEAVRDRGKVIVVGQVGMRVPRKTFYDKELSLLMSRSYGPGRYDRSYEEKGVDYPIGYVRWTENRNMRAFIDLLASGRLSMGPLISHRFPIDEAVRAYDIVTGKTPEPHIGILLEYRGAEAHAVVPPRSGQVTAVGNARVAPSSTARGAREVSVGVIGAGAFARGVLLPALRDARGVHFVAVCSRRGVSARDAAKRFGFDRSVSDADDILGDPAIDAVVIVTRPDSHADLVDRALAAGKHIFVEKPLAVNAAQLNRLSLRESAEPAVLVGFNRRYAPQVRQLKRFFGDRTAPVVAVYRVNAGHLPPDDWQMDPEQGGGRIIGEVGHFVDLFSYLTGGLPVEVYAGAVGDAAKAGVSAEDTALTIRLSDGSVGVLVYTTGGSASFPKERLEVFSGGRVAVLDDFRTLTLVGQRRQSRRSWLRQDKGHRDQMKTFLDVVRGRVPPPVVFSDYVLTTWCTMLAVRSMQTGRPQPVSLASLADAVASSQP